jgi:ABC-type Fe3+ transport system permease subunit
LIAIVPLVNLGLDAGTRLDRAAGEMVTRRWSVEQFATVVLQSPWHFRREIGWTAAIACGAACCALAISLPLTWGLNSMSWRMWLALIVTSLAAATPGPVVALAVISCMNREGSQLLVWLYDRTLLPPILAATVRALPVVMLVSWWGARTIPPALFDLARLDGLNLIGQWWHLGRPLRSRVYFIAWCAAVAAAVGDLAATLLVTPPGVNTLAMRIFGLLHAGVDDQVAGISLANVLFCVFLALLVLHISRRWRNI